MSTCISSRGEYSSHDPDADYVCTYCGALDEDGLFTELRRLRAEVAITPASTYRLPDWLGGHPCRILDYFTPGTDGPVWVQIEETISPTHHHYAPVGLLRSSLVEVRPPSIDDPEPLPLNLPETADEYGLTVRRGERGEPAIVTVRSSARNLTADEARRVARVLWQRANAAEAASNVE